MILKRASTQEVLCSQVDSATSFKKRLFGLMGTKAFNDSALYIPRSNWIHTFFMNFPIDVIYLDKKMKICKIDHQLKPWRFPKPVFSARSLIEMPEGSATQLNLQVGEELYVGH